MNLTFPVADWLFGTSDLDRGLFGHLCNGYNNKYLKKDLRGQPTGPDVAAAQPMRWPRSAQSLTSRHARPEAIYSTDGQAREPCRQGIR